MSCTVTPFFDSVSACPGSVTVYAVFDPQTSYYWIITDPFGNVYQEAFTTDSEGVGILETSQLPDGFCNPFLPSFQLQAKADPADLDFQKLTFSDVDYDSAIVGITGGTLMKNTIGISPSSSGSYLLVDQGGDLLTINATDDLLIIS